MALCTEKLWFSLDITPAHDLTRYPNWLTISYKWHISQNKKKSKQIMMGPRCHCLHMKLIETESDTLSITIVVCSDWQWFSQVEAFHILQLERMGIKPRTCSTLKLWPLLLRGYRRVKQIRIHKQLSRHPVLSSANSPAELGASLNSIHNKPWQL